jgi:hypothetical protein
MQATLAKPETDASTAIQQAAAQQGWALAPAKCGGGWLVFEKGVSAFSWGAELRVHLQPISAGETRLTISTGETFALTDWGRGKRAAKRLFDAVGAS